MKTLGKFLTEKEEEKKSQGSRPLRKGEGHHDQEYIDTMGHYKHKARHELPHEQAREFLNHAKKLRKHGDVSADARTAGAYI